jgi:hypothetical protein
VVQGLVFSKQQLTPPFSGALASSSLGFGVAGDSDAVGVGVTLPAALAVRFSSEASAAMVVVMPG